MQPGEQKPREPDSGAGSKPDDSSRTAGGAGHAGMGHGGSGMEKKPLSPVWQATPTQKAVFSILSVLALAAGIILSATFANLRLSARDVGGAVMPPGMIMLRDTPGQAMRDMAAVDPRTVSYTPPPDARGDQPFEPRLENGVKVYDLEASVIKWNILPDVQVMVYAFNNQVPGPPDARAWRAVHHRRHGRQSSAGRRADLEGHGRRGPG